MKNIMAIIFLLILLILLLVITHKNKKEGFMTRELYNITHRHQLDRVMQKMLKDVTGVLSAYDTVYWLDQKTINRLNYDMAHIRDGLTLSIILNDRYVLHDMENDLYTSGYGTVSYPTMIKVFPLNGIYPKDINRISKDTIDFLYPHIILQINDVYNGIIYNRVNKEKIRLTK